MRQPSTEAPALDLSTIWIFTVTEANAMVPRMELAAADLNHFQEEYLNAREHREELTREYGRSIMEADHPYHQDWHTCNDQESRAQGQIYKIMKQLRAEGIQVKDTRIGLMDLHALRGNSIVNLCWKAGEKEVSHWHPLEGGITKRQPIHREEFFGE